MSRDIQKYLDAVEADAEGIDSEVGLLTTLMQAAWDGMAPASRDAFLAHDDVLACDAAALAYDVDDGEYAKPDSLATLFKNAAQHGEDSEPEHEVGDIQSYLISFKDVASDEEWSAFEASPAAVETLSHAAAPGR